MMKILLSIFFIMTLLMQGCSWLSSKPESLDNNLTEAMQASIDINSVEAASQNMPLKVHYEIKHKPRRNQQLTILLEIKPLTEFASSAFAVKVPETIDLIAPQNAINLGGLKAGETYLEEILLQPSNEGMYQLEVFIAAALSGQASHVKRIPIPISIGPIEISRE